MYFQQLMPALTEMSCKILIMIAIGLTLFFWAIKKQYKNTPFLQIGFEAILVNIPFSAILTKSQIIGPLNVFFNAGIVTEIFPYKKEEEK